MWHHLQHCVQFWVPQYPEGIGLWCVREHVEESNRDSKESRGQDLGGVAEVT